jgi:hypothetical protein
MDPRRLRFGEWILGAGSALLLVSLFMGWYEGKNVEVRTASPSGDYTLTAFEAFGGIDLVLAGGALLGLALVAASAMQRVSALSIAGSAVVALVSMGLLLLVLYCTVRIPDFETSRGVFFDSTRDTGIWVALGGSVLMLAGSLATMRDERITGDTRSVDPADIETLPAPQPGS